MEAALIPWRTLGELFVQRGLITNDQLEQALAEQATGDRRLGEILVERGLVSATDLRQALMEQLGVEISEEGLGSNLWAEIKRRHEGSQSDEDGADEDELPLPPAAYEDPPPQPPALTAVPSLEATEPESPTPAEPIEFAGESETAAATSIAILRAELAEARAEADHLREMLADSMTALSALISEGGPSAESPADADDALQDS